MRIVDVNVLVYAVAEDMRHHIEAKRWLDGALSGQTPVGFSWLALIGFIRVVTMPAFPQRFSVDEAMSQVDAWLGARSAHLVQPGASHAAHLRALLEVAGTAGNLTNDAHLAALALEHRATVVSFDADFDRFPGVRWERPR